MKRFTIILLAICLSSCKHAHSQKVNPIARKLNDSATMLRMSKAGFQLEQRIGKDSLSKIQLALLNQATEIDSNYLIAYWNKFGVQQGLKQYIAALATGKELIRLKPNDATFKFLVGKMYDKTGDTVSARRYYQDYLSYCDHKLDTMSTANKYRNAIELQKALVLVLLNEQQKGHDILNKLYTQADSSEKDRYLLYMRVTRADMLEGKNMSITAGNSTTSISTEFP